MDSEYNLALIIGAVFSLLAALLHLGVIVSGPAAYELAGAGKRFVRAAEAGKAFPAVITFGIALVLSGWAVYALSGAGVIGPLPLLRPALCIITAVYLLRGVVGPFFLIDTGRSTRFIVLSSLICTLFGAVHAIGLLQVWAQI